MTRSYNSEKKKTGDFVYCSDHHRPPEIVGKSKVDFTELEENSFGG